MAELVVSVPVAAPAAVAWERLVDWDAHRGWMTATTARVTSRAADGTPRTLEAFTGVGRVGVLDPMTVTHYSPGRCVVRHTGRAVRGAGAFEVEPTGLDTCRVVWSEWPVLPLGPAGQVGWLLARPLAARWLRRCLIRLARAVEGAAREGAARGGPASDAAAGDAAAGDEAVGD